MKNDDGRDHWAQSTAEPLDGMPAGVRPISLDALNYLGVSADGELYWMDTKILTAKREFRLSFWQGLGAAITVLAAVAAAIAASVSAYVDLSTFEASQQQMPQR